MNRFRQAAVVIAIATGVACNPAFAATLKLDFESLPLEGADYYNGSDLAGGFSSYGVGFNNLYTAMGSTCCWNGWAYSRTTNTTSPGPLNQYSAYAGTGANGSPTYGVAFSGFDAGGGIIPMITLPTGAEPTGVLVTNTTYAALSMKFGDGFAKKFGGPSGNDADWFRLTVEGRNANNTLLGQVQYYLADYRFANSAQDYILNTWHQLDLTPLAGLGVRKLAFRLSSSDTGIFGMNTPAYVAIDNLTLQVVSTPGDFDLDGDVDNEDLATWNSNYGATFNGGVTTGDADGDGDVDGEDFLMWQRYYNPSLPLRAIVPEPASFVLTSYLIALPVFCRRPLRRRTSRKSVCPRLKGSC